MRTAQSKDLQPCPQLSATKLTLLALPLLTGCMVGPKYVAPTPPTAPNFKEATDPNWQPAQPAAEIPRGAWWTVFNDDGLSALEPQVASANQTLKAADAHLRAARAAIGIDSARKLPTLAISPYIYGERQSAQKPFSNATSTNEGESDISLPLQLTYEVDLWGRVRRGITEATEQSQAAAADRETALLSLQAELALDYFELRAADAQQKLFDATVAQYQDAVRVTNNRFTGGVAPKSDLTQAQTQLAAAKVASADVAIRRAQYEHAIANLIGQPPANFSLPLSPLPLDVLPPNIPPGLPAQLLERRPDIASQERLTAAANERIGIARAAFFPTVSLTGAVGFETTTASTLLTPSNFVYAVGPALAETLFDGGRRRSLSEQTKAEYAQQTANYRQTVLTAYQQVEDNLIALRVLNDEAMLQHQATGSAQESERIFNNRYVGGVDTYLQVITAQTTALNNERNDIDILRRRMDATVLLIKALGGGWTRAQLPPR